MSEDIFKESIINYEVDPSLSSVKVFVSLKRFFSLIEANASKDFPIIVTKVQKLNEKIYVYAKPGNLQPKEPFEDLEYRYVVSQAKLDKLFFDLAKQESEYFIQDIAYQVTPDDVIMVMKIVKNAKPVEVKSQDSW